MEEIKANPHRFLQVFRPSMLKGDFADELPAGVLALYSRWSGYLKQPDWKRTQELIQQAGGQLLEVHTSGHIFSADIERFITGIRPESIIPIHTFEPEQFEQAFPNTIMLTDGVPHNVE